MPMKPEDLERFLAMGTNEEELIELLRQQKVAEEDIAATRGASPTISAGRGNVVPNFMDPIQGMFERGRAGKAKKEAEGAAANNRAEANQDIRAFIDSQMQGQREAEFIHQPGGIAPEAAMPMPQVAPLGGPPAGGPAGPPAPAMGGPPNAAPAPSPAVGPGPPTPQTPPQEPPGLGDVIPTTADFPQVPIRHSPGAPGKPPVDPALNPDGTKSIVEMILQNLRRGGR